MTKGFAIQRFNPGTKIVRIRPANSGDRSFMGWPGTLISIGKKDFIVRYNEHQASHCIRTIDFDMQFKFGWLKLSDIEDSRHGIPQEAIDAIKNNQEAGFILEQCNREMILRAWYERQLPYQEREKYKIRHGLSI
jgi:hypothetical protein